MRRIYDTYFESRKSYFINEEIKCNRDYAITSRFLSAPLPRNLIELGGGYYGNLANIIEGDIVGIFFILENGKYFLLSRKVNPYA